MGSTSGYRENVIDNNQAGTVDRGVDGCIDGDADGIRDAADACRSTPTGVEIDGPAPGCAAFDPLLVEPLEVPAVLQRLGEARGLLSGPGLAHPEVRELADAARAFERGLGTARTALRRRDPCAARSSWRDAVGAFGGALSTFEDALPDLRQRLVQEPADWDPEHFGDGVLERIPIDLGHAAARDTFVAAQSGDPLVAAPCDALGDPTSRRGVVEHVEDALGYLRLEDGTLVLGSPTASADPGYSVGQDVVVQGSALGASVLADSIVAAQASDPLPSVLGCLELRVLPVQGLPPWDYGPWTVHPLAAYRAPSGTHQLEQGTRLTAVAHSCPGVEPSPGPGIQTFVRYSLRILIDQRGETSSVVDDLQAFELSPPLVEVGAATLIATTRKQECEIDPFLDKTACGPFLEVDERIHPIEIHPFLSVCKAFISPSRLSLEDHDFEGVRFTSVIGLTTAPTATDGATQIGFWAQNCVAPTGPECSGGSLVPIGLFYQIRIYNLDFVPLHGFVGTYDGVAALLSHGVQQPAGLRWPRLVGTRNGRPFHYTCEVPAVVRDVIDFCPSEADDAFYRYPWYPTDYTPFSRWVLGNGNFAGSGPCVSPLDPWPGGHGPAQCFAFDFGAHSGTEIRAARGGRAVLLVEDQTLTEADCPRDPDDPNVFLDPACAEGNYLYMRHQDGTHGAYFHVAHQSVVPQKGDVVFRGDPIAQVGETGRASGPHLHFQAQEIPGTDGSESIPVFFETPQDTCYVPPEDDPLPSNNDPSLH